jgi:hypothetical protein
LPQQFQPDTLSNPTFICAPQTASIYLLENLAAAQQQKFLTQVCQLVLEKSVHILFSHLRVEKYNDESL